MNSKLKRIFLSATILFAGLSLFAQVPKGWHLQDKEKTGNYGISVDKAYDFLKSTGRKNNKVIVAVIDSGVDTAHEDLKPILWINKKEIQGNGIDDDKNGYIDDIYGWNFIGSNDGKKNVTKDSYEVARVYFKLKDKWESKTVDEASLSADEKYEYEMWARAKAEVGGSADTKEPSAGEQLAQVRGIFQMISECDSLISNKLSIKTYKATDVEKFKPVGEAETKAQKVMQAMFGAMQMPESTNVELFEKMKEDITQMEEEAANSTDKKPSAPPVPFRADVVNDNYYDINDKFYGNNNVFVDKQSSFHGTHVSGIIAALRGNGKGVDGVANNVEIMSIRAVPDGDEHDKDIALAIRYAVDNGAKVINMSFGKSYSPEKQWVDEAVDYANKHGVLLVHAAGNSAQNNDSTFNFPNSASKFGTTKTTNWIEVGASGYNNKDGHGLTAGFSNYGKQMVDVFAPGVQIYSTVPGGNTYGNAQGTSMASPVVAGIAALVLQYYPELTAQEVKQAIENSLVKTDELVATPGNNAKVLLSDISRNGGIVNAAGAVEYASKLAAAKTKIVPIKKPKTKIKRKKRA